MANRINDVNLKRRKWLMYVAIMVLAVAIPVSIKLLMRKYETDLIVTFMVLVAGCLYELYSPWIEKLLKYKKLVEEAIQKGEEPPDAEKHFKHGVKFNKWFLVFQVFNFCLAFLVAYYLITSEDIVIKPWWLNAYFNFMYAVGQAKILKERIF